MTIQLAVCFIDQCEGGSICSELGNLVLQTPFAERPPANSIQSFELFPSMESPSIAAVLPSKHVLTVCHSRTESLGCAVEILTYFVLKKEHKI